MKFLSDVEKFINTAEFDDELTTTNIKEDSMIIPKGEVINFLRRIKQFTIAS